MPVEKTEKPKSKKLRPYPSIDGGARDTQVLRGHKMIQPACMVWDTQYKTWNTGPCQTAIADNRALAMSWYRNCTHGAAQEDIDKSGWPGLTPPYYEFSYKEIKEDETEVQEDGSLLVTKETTKRVKVIKPRITQVAVSSISETGRGYVYARRQGFVDLHVLGIAPMCEFWNCWKPARREYMGFPEGHGFFCNEYHAKLIKATEGLAGGGNRLIVMDYGHSAGASDERAEWLAGIQV